MTSKGKTHQKHAHLAKPHIGEFARNELAILGTPCSEIKAIASGLIALLASRYSITYIDADHQSSDDSGLVGEGATLNYTDKIDFQRLDFKGSVNPYSIKYNFNNQDLVLVNGNHFLAKEQVVVIDERKNFEKKLDRLSNVKLFLLMNGSREIPEYIKNHIPDWENIPMMDAKDINGIAEFITQKITTEIPALKGLVLAGGKSQRMNTDKGKLHYHGVEQRKYMYDLISNMGMETFMSCRSDQVDELSQYKLIEDTFLDLGPLGAILSALREDPNAAWLVVACDLPLVDVASLKHLIDNRDPTKSATAFKSPSNDFPEPLIAIWEPSVYPTALQLLGLGYSCARKALINSDTKIIEAQNVEALRNVNHPEEFADVIKLLEG